MFHINYEESAVIDKSKEYEEKYDEQLKESNSDADRLSANTDNTNVETKVEYYRKIQTLRRASRVRPE